MSTEIKVPTFPESISEGTIAKWHKKIGDTIKRDENLVDVETDKVVLEVPAPFDGVLDEIIKKEGETVEADTVIGRLKEGKAEEGKAKKKEEEKAPVQEKKIEKEEAKKPKAAEMDLSPSVRRLVAEHDIDVSEVAGTGKEGRLTKEDVERHLETEKESKEKEAGKKKEPEQKAVPEEKEHAEGDRLEKRVPMTRLRARIAERLLSAQQNMAILTTFNEINMHQVIDLRTEYRDLFEKKHGVRLGFMSFFIRATTIALKRFPDVNASIEGNEIIYHGYCDIGVAVSTERGLVVPVLRNADQMSMAEMEAKIAEFSTKARDNKLTLEEMTGGTFTITNGGVFGSLLATPIVNPPQSAILGMHKIEDRPIVEKGQIVVRPMMYVALSYDHRIIDGKDSVQFLRTVKELLEDPGRLLLDV